MSAWSLSLPPSLTFIKDGGSNDATIQETVIRSNLFPTLGVRFTCHCGAFIGASAKYR
jgi:hypothetical protein